MMRTACVIALLLSLTAVVRAERGVKATVYTRAGKRQGYVLPTSDGSLKMSQRPDMGGVLQTIRRGSIRRLLTAKHPGITKIEKDFDAGKYDEVIKDVDRVPQQVKWLGWGGWAYYLKAQAYMAKKDYAKAKAAARDGKRYGNAEGRGDLLDQVILAAEIAGNPSQPGLRNRLLRARPSPGKYKMLGILAQAQAGKKDNDRQLLMEAAIQYMKVVLVYSAEDLEDDPGGTADRKEAYARLIQVLTLLNDKSKAEQFAAMRKQDYGR